MAEQFLDDMIKDAHDTGTRYLTARDGSGGSAAGKAGGRAGVGVTSRGKSEAKRVREITRDVIACVQAAYLEKYPGLTINPARSEDTRRGMCVQFHCAGKKADIDGFYRELVAAIEKRLPEDLQSARVTPNGTLVVIYNEPIEVEIIGLAVYCCMLAFFFFGFAKLCGFA